LKLTAIAPVLNEVDFIGYSVMAALPYICQFIYALDEKSDDGTRELLNHIKKTYAHEKLIAFRHPNFHPSDTAAYDAAFNACIEKATGDAIIFLHPDMIITEFKPLEQGPLAWWTTIKSFAGDFQTEITKGRATRWKNIHARKFGLHYAGAYGSQNEDFYHRDITGNSYRHYGEEFSKYPYQVADSGIKINHYCELKDYSRRLEKMKLCLKTLYPRYTDEFIEENAIQHPRVTLEPTSLEFGRFEFAKTTEPVPFVFEQYKKEFDAFKKELIPNG